MVPGLLRQSSLSASFLEKLFPRKTVFRRDLWKKESTLRVIDDQEPMAPDLDRLGKNWLQRGKQRNLDAHFLKPGLFHGSEARIFEGGAHGAANDSLA